MAQHVEWIGVACEEELIEMIDIALERGDVTPLEDAPAAAEARARSAIGPSASASSG